ncbi:MAG: hypothetical protein Q9222_002974 [Ikaeria aurantiellina]
MLPPPPSSRPALYDVGNMHCFVAPVASPTQQFTSDNTRSLEQCNRTKLSATPYPIFPIMPSSRNPLPTISEVSQYADYLQEMKANQTRMVDDKVNQMLSNVEQIQQIRASKRYLKAEEKLQRDYRELKGLEEEFTEILDDHMENWTTLIQKQVEAMGFQFVTLSDLRLAREICAKTVIILWLDMVREVGSMELQTLELHHRALFIKRPDIQREISILLVDHWKSERGI